MRHSLIVSVLLFTSMVFGSEGRSETHIQVAATCFKSGEQISGMNKICYYNCMGSQAAITVDFTDLCPLTIDQ